MRTQHTRPRGPARDRARGRGGGVRPRWHPRPVAVLHRSITTAYRYVTGLRRLARGGQGAARLSQHGHPHTLRVRVRARHRRALPRVPFRGRKTQGLPAAATFTPPPDAVGTNKPLPCPTPAYPGGPVADIGGCLGTAPATTPPNNHDLRPIALHGALSRNPSSLKRRAHRGRHQPCGGQPEAAQQATRQPVSSWVARTACQTPLGHGEIARLRSCSIRVEFWCPREPEPGTEHVDALLALLPLDAGLTGRATPPTRAAPRGVRRGLATPGQLGELVHGPAPPGTCQDVPVPTGATRVAGTHSWTARSSCT